MPVYFIDLDGTIFKHGTNDFLPGAVEWLKSLRGQVVFCTRRGAEFGDHPIYGCAGLRDAYRMLEQLGLDIIGLITDCGSPRIIVNDEDSSVILHETNAPWELP